MNAIILSHSIEAPSPFLRQTGLHLPHSLLIRRKSRLHAVLLTAHRLRLDCTHRIGESQFTPARFKISTSECSLYALVICISFFPTSSHDRHSDLIRFDSPLSLWPLIYIYFNGLYRMPWYDVATQRSPAWLISFITLVNSRHLESGPSAARFRRTECHREYDTALASPSPVVGRESSDRRKRKRRRKKKKKKKKIMRVLFASSKWNIQRPLCAPDCPFSRFSLHHLFAHFFPLHYI